MSAPIAPRNEGPAPLQGPLKAPGFKDNLGNIATRTAGTGGIGGGSAWLVVSYVPDEWKPIIAGLMAIVTAVLAAVQPFIETWIVKTLKLWYLRWQIKRYRKKCKKIIDNPSAHIMVKKQALIALQKLDEAEFKIVIKQASQLAQESLDITGPLPKEIVAEAIRKGEEDARRADSGALPTGQIVDQKNNQQSNQNQ